jgi:hypothetical protein
MLLPMSHMFLQGAWAKLERAEFQFTKIKQKTISGFDSDQNPIQRKLDDRTGRVVWVWCDGNQKHWIDLSLDIGELFHNLRSCLDYIAWGLARTVTSTPFRRTAFPLLDNDSNWKSTTRNELRDVPRFGVEFIERFQPFQFRNRSFNRHLQIINKLNNIDKHALLNVAVTPLARADDETSIAGADLIESVGDIPLLEAKPGDELFSADGIPLDADSEDRFTFIDLIDEPRQGIILKTRGDIPRLIRAVRFVMTKADAGMLARQVD